MTMSWSTVTVKYLLFIFNLLFVLTGIIILCAGVSIKAYFTYYDGFLEQQYFSAPNLLIAIGAIIFFIAFFGCCGAVKQNYCMIITFSTLLILIFVLEFAAGISGYVLQGQTEEYLNKSMHNNMAKYKAPNATEITFVWDLIQTDFRCCGVQSYKDWLPYTNDTIPISCCKIPPGVTGSFTCAPDSESLYKPGCIQGFETYVGDHAVTVGAVGLGFAAVQIVGILCSCYLAKQVKQNYEYM